MTLRLGRIAGVAALAGAILVGSQSLAQVKQGKTRPLKTAHLMSGLIGPNCSALGKELQGDGPADDKAWAAAAARAGLLNESGHLLMDDGRCPDKTWADACKTLRDCSAVVLTKIEAKDASGAREAFTAMVGSCKACHTAHKK
jgi:hypothetical protein